MARPSTNTVHSDSITNIVFEKWKIFTIRQCHLSRSVQWVWNGCLECCRRKRIIRNFEMKPFLGFAHEMRLGLGWWIRSRLNKINIICKLISFHAPNATCFIVWFAKLDFYQRHAAGIKCNACFHARRTTRTYCVLFISDGKQTETSRYSVNMRLKR